jgi:hypothetical protein
VLKHREALAAALHDGTLPFTAQPTGAPPDHSHPRSDTP